MSKATRTAPRLSEADARGMLRICRRAESVEDRNVIQQFADKGSSLLSPNVTQALIHASGDIRGEAASARRLDPVLSGDMASEALVLANAGHAVQLRSDEGALLAVLHRRITAAHSSGVSGCAGTQAAQLLTKAPAA